MSEQIQNFTDAILKKRARVEEINLIVSRPLPGGGSAQNRRDLIEERLRLELAITELKSAAKAEERRFSERLFTVETIDRRLLAPKTNELAYEIHERRRHAENKISFETARSGKAAAYLARLLDFDEKLTDEWAGRLFRAYCDAWIEQNRPILPSFVRAVRDPSVPTSLRHL
jgi:hypothetical protein